MNERGRSVSSDALPKYKDETPMDSMDKKLKYNSVDSGFGEQDGEGSPVNQRHSTHGECPRLEFDHLEDGGEKVILEDYSDTSMERTDQVKMKSSHDMVNSGIISRSAGHPRTGSDGSVSSYVEISTLFASGNTNRDKEEVIVAEVVPVVRCAPKPIPKFNILQTHPSEDVMLKSGDLFLRAIEDRDKPKIIIDKIRKRFKHQYCFKSETKQVLDTDGKSHCLKSFRHDFGNKSFYLVPHKTTGAHRTTTGSERVTTTGSGNNTTTTRNCPETIIFTCVEVDRDDVVINELSNRNSKFWYTFKMTSFPGVLESLAHPNYFVSFEKDLKAVLRKSEDPDSESDSFKIDIIPYVSYYTHLQHFKRLLQTFSCTR